MKSSGMFSGLGINKRRKSSKTKQKPRNSKNLRSKDKPVLRIGGPTGFKHKGHMEKDPRATWGISGLPEEWKALLKGANITKERILENQANAIFALKAASALKKSPRKKFDLLTAEQLKDRMDSTGALKRGNPASRYRKIEVIGKGAGGTVYRAKDRESGKDVAVKVSALEELDFIKNEVAYHALCQHHNVVSYHGTWETQRDVWIVMDLIDGGCLTDVLGDDTDEVFWTEPHIAYVMHECLQGLNFMHGQYLLHRDIKSDNVLIGRNGTIKLADFGFAVGLSKERSKRRTTVGTPFWMAPEVIEGKDYDDRCDLWSLGVTGIELTDHQPPHMDKQHVEALLDILTLPSPSPKEPEMWSKVLLDFLAKILDKDCLKRSTAAQILGHEFLSGKAQINDFSGLVCDTLDSRADRRKYSKDSDDDY